MAKKYLKLASTLKKLLFERDMKPVELSREVNLPPTTIHRLITGKSTRPYRSSLKPIADFFSISVDQLLGEFPLTSSFDSAEKKIEKNKISFLPLVEWEKLFEISSYEKCKRIPFLGDISSQAFSVKLNDSSMEPQFSKGSILIFDPEKKPTDRSYILAKLENNIFVFRQFLIDENHQFLKPLNPDLNTFKIKLLEKNDRVVSVLIEARHFYDRN